MKNEKLRRALADMSERNDYEIKILDDQAYDESIVGITDDGRLIYSYYDMIAELEEEEEIPHEDAMEWVDYNTMRAIPYMGENAPIVMHMSRKDILYMYGSENDA